MAITAVEWLVNQMKAREALGLTVSMYDLEMFAEQAKEMEKQQMIDFYVKGAEDWYDGFYKVDSAEQHYNKNFKSE